MTGITDAQFEIGIELATQLQHAHDDILNGDDASDRFGVSLERILEFRKTVSAEDTAAVFDEAKAREAARKAALRGIR